MSEHIGHIRFFNSVLSFSYTARETSLPYYLTHVISEGRIHKFITFPRAKVIITISTQIRTLLTDFSIRASLGIGKCFRRWAVSPLVTVEHQRLTGKFRNAVKLFFIAYSKTRFWSRLLWLSYKSSLEIWNPSFHYYIKLV